MASHQTSPPLPSVKDVERALSAVDFPLSKQELVACLEAQGEAADAAVARQLRALPLATYRSVDEVLSSISVTDR